MFKTQLLEFSCAVRRIYTSLGTKGLNVVLYIGNRMENLDAKALSLWTVTETNEMLLQLTYFEAF